MSVSQKEAVVSAVGKILGKSFVVGSTNVKETISGEQLTQLRDTIFTGIQAGDIAYNKDIDDEKTVRRYVNGMIDNHFRKAKELNGGAAYAAKTSNGSRGIRDPQLAALRKLSKNYESGSQEQSKVLSAINSRESQLTQERLQNQASKKREAQLKNIDVIGLPPELADILNK